MTETELKLMAAAARMGLNFQPNTGYRTPAAMGTPIIAGSHVRRENARRPYCVSRTYAKIAELVRIAWLIAILCGVGSFAAGEVDGR